MALRVLVLRMYTLNVHCCDCTGLTYEEHVTAVLNSIPSPERLKAMVVDFDEVSFMQEIEMMGAEEYLPLIG
jgi:hypothetical protein